jgi:(p)ppGpp synthase/HD superfamily hydrolase
MSTENPRPREVLADDDLVREAHRLSCARHAEQRDKAGFPYIDHPRRVATRVADFGAEYVAVAWLHDLLEDQGVTPQELRERGFSEPIIAAVIAMTKEATDKDDDAIERACADPIALVVKAADVADNSDPARLRLLPHATRRRLEGKYRRYRQVLDQHGAPTFPQMRH